ncbi:MAG: YebC/PmpR family DNA-binding transcriptional regulator, partial [Dehalococcoidia bacterium]|nr:YebC/PmpR family DNA-binding transcriptional regulator [Dehalococcoidia bacterium]
SQIKRQKGVNDAHRGQIFTKLSREISVAARLGGGDPDGNFRLRLSIQRARDLNLPMENVERAIKRGIGELGGSALDEVVYEGYGPGGTAFLVQALTDNRNRTVAEVRHAFERCGGRLGESGCVAWLFEPQGIITVKAEEGPQSEELAMVAIEAGAEDVQVNDGSIDITTEPQRLEQVRKALEGSGAQIVSVEDLMQPKSTVALDGKEALQALRLLDKLEDLDDAQKAFSNADIPDEIMEQYEG